MEAAPTGARVRPMIDRVLAFAASPSIPGIPDDYLTDQGITQILALHEKVMNTAWYLFAILVIVSAGLVVTGLLTSMQISTQEIVKNGILVVVLLLGFDIFFGFVFNAGHYVASTIVSDDDFMQLAKDMRDKANATDGGGAADSNWLSLILTTLGKSIINPGIGLAMLLIGLAIAIFLLAALFINIAWLALAVAAYTFSPIALALGIIPRWGSKLIESWISSLVQLAAWQIWMAICAWFVKLGPFMFLQSSGSTGSLDTLDTRLSLETGAMCLVFAALYMATPWIISAYLPISHFGFHASRAIQSAYGMISGTAGAITSAAGTVAGAAAGGPAGAMAGSQAGGGGGLNSAMTAGGAGGGGGLVSALPAGGGGAAPGNP